VKSLRSNNKKGLKYMAEFSKLVITSKGQALLAKMIAGSGDIEFTKVSASSTAYTDAQLEGLASLSNVKQTSLISKITRTNEVAIKVETSFTNTELTEGYYMKALGLYAVDPDVGEILYAITRETSGNCYMPAYNGITVSGAYVQLVTTVGNAENVSLEVDQAAVATIGDIQDLQKQIENKVDLVDGKIDPSQIPVNVVPIVNTSGSGTMYTATVDGVTTLKTGMLLVIIPHVASTSTSPTLTINNLGARTISRRTSTTTTAGSVGCSSNWIAANKPLLIQYDGSYWVAIGQAKPNAADLIGTTPVNRGGTGKTSWTAYQLIYPSSSTTLAQLSFPTIAGSFLRQNTSGAPYWTTPTQTLEAIGAVAKTDIGKLNGVAGLNSNGKLSNMPNAADVGAVPTTRTVNGKALSSDITLSVNDIGVGNLFLAVYPVGSIYMTTVGTNPGTLFGGTWVAWGSGRVPVGVNTADTDFNAVEKTGGEKTHTLTVAELPLHDHTIPLYWGTGSTEGERALTQGLDNSNPKMYQGEANRPHTTVTGNEQAHNNLQPYITCYMWRRTA